MTASPITAAIVCCNQRDAAMLPIFRDRWQQIYPEIPLILGNCVIDPVTDDHDMPTVPIDWREFPARSIMRGMLQVAMDYDVEVVWKVDVDCWHRGDFISPIMRDQSVMACGVQWLDQPHYFLGLAYAIRRSLLLAMEVKVACSQWAGGEDYAMSWMARKLTPNAIYLLPSTTARRAQTDDGTAMVVHCGCYYHDEDPRGEALTAMRDYAVRASSSASK